MKRIVPAFLLVCAAACSSPELMDVSALRDNDPSTSVVVESEKCEFVFDGFKTPIRSYKVYSSGNLPESDPCGWVLYGSMSGRDWVELDRREDVRFCSRFQESVGVIASPSDYVSYKLVVHGKKGGQLAIGDVRFFEKNIEANWENFKYPEVNFEVSSPDTEGAKIYSDLVQDPEEYVRYHTRKVAEILFYTADDPMNTVGKINYYLKDYDGVSYKDGVPAETTVVYSTRHIERSARESMYKLDYETRGVLYHELVHAYQFEPKGIGSYSTNKEFWACIEGLADAVRTEAGLFDVAALRKPGGHWLDGYKTTGFFLQWLTTKDPNAIRKFHITVRDMEVWSFDKAMRAVFGSENGIEKMWNEYQEYLLSQTQK